MAATSTTTTHRRGLLAPKQLPNNYRTTTEQLPVQCTDHYCITATNRGSSANIRVQQEPPTATANANNNNSHQQPQRRATAREMQVTRATTTSTRARATEPRRHGLHQQQYLPSAACTRTQECDKTTSQVKSESWL